MKRKSVVRLKTSSACCSPNFITRIIATEANKLSLCIFFNSSLLNVTAVQPISEKKRSNTIGRKV